MRAELPWNVAGIPPEAREAARAAARREGLSVGEWLTRRILRSFSDLGEETSPPSQDRLPERASQLDPWGMPPPSSSKRDTEDMLNRVSRTEAESSDAFRRIDEHLRSVSRRLDSAERSQSENNRVVNKAASEINIASREQAQVFDQLGEHVVAINGRLERLERTAAQDGLKDAVKGLHQGMSRLADQVTQTANQSAQQITTITGNMEQLAGRLGDQIAETANESAQHITAISGNLEHMAGRLRQIRTDVEDATRRLDGRVSEIEEESRDRFSAFEAEVQRNLDQRLAALEKSAELNASTLDQRLAAGEKAAEFNASALDQRLAAGEKAAQINASALDQRLAAVEKSAQFNTNALDHALERLEAQAGTRAGDQAELQRRHAETDGAISRIEESIERLEAHSSDPTMERRLDGIERALGSLVSRLETYDPAAALEDTLRGLVRRIDTVEKNHSEMMDELRANLAGGAKPVIAAAEPTYDPALFDPQSFDAKPFALPESDFNNPPFAESLPPFSDDHADFAPADAHPSADQDPFAADSFETGAFAPAADDAADPTSDNFLAAARRSAKAAAEVENNRGSRLGFAWGSTAAAKEGAEPQSSRLTVWLIVAIVIVLALFAGVTLSQRLRASHSIAPVAPPAAHSNAPFAPAPKEMPSAGSTSAQAPFLESARPTTAKPAAPASVQPILPPLPKAPSPASPQANIQSGPQAGPPQLFAPASKVAPVPTLDRVTQLANGGNATAQTILGLKELDADGVPANPADAAKWLERAAEQGQAVAQYRLGSIYERGLGVPANPASAVRWYQLAANQGNRKAMHNLAVADASGAAGKKDLAEAARWFAKAADLGLADSQFNLAVLYERGDGVPQSLLDAYKWYAIAASQGDAESKSRLSVLATQLSDDDRNAAQKSAATFRAAPLNRVANVPPEMADLAGN